MVAKTMVPDDKGFAKSGDKLVERARALAPLLRRNADAVEQQRRLTDENIAALEKANLFSILLPRRWGGERASLETFLRVCEEVSAACPSTGWVHYISNVGAWIGTMLPDAAQREIFAKGPIRQCGVAMPGGKGTPVEGGFRITGRWPYASGSLEADWASVSVMLSDENTGWFDVASAWLPITDVVIEDSWHVAGMRGTGSNTLVLNDVFVPAHLMISRDDLGSPDRELNGEPSDRWTFRSQIVASAAGALIGVARGMLEHLVTHASQRRISYTNYTRQDDSQIFQRDIAECTLKLSAARLMGLANARLIDQFAIEGRSLDYAERARIRGETCHVAMLCREASDIMMSLGGASAFANSSMMQRHWRDLGMISRHGFLVQNPGLEIYGRSILGVEASISPDV